MRVAMVGLCLLLFSTVVWAGTWRDNFENGDLGGWQKWEWPGQNTGKIEERNGILTVTDINAKFDTVAAFNNRQHVGDFTMVVDARITKANEGVNSYLEVLFRAEEDNGNWRWAWLICYANGEAFLGLDTLMGNVWRKIERIKLPFTIVVGEWHNIKLGVEGTQITLWIDRKLVQQVDWREHRAELPEAGEIQIGVAGGESQWDNFVLSSDEVPDFSDLSIVPKDKLTTYWASLKRS